VLVVIPNANWAGMTAWWVRSVFAFPSVFTLVDTHWEQPLCWYMEASYLTSASDPGERLRELWDEWGSSPQADQVLGVIRKAFEHLRRWQCDALADPTKLLECP